MSALLLLLVSVATAQGGGSAVAACGVLTYAYAGVQADTKADGVSANLTTLAPPTVVDGHVGGWIGLGGVHAGPGGAAEWIQTGFAAFTSDRTSQAYYEVTVAGASPHYVEVQANVAAGVTDHFSVVEIVNRPTWWRVWLNGAPVSPPIHLPGSDHTWYPQVVGENWNGGTGACNSYSYSFSDVALAARDNGVWAPLKESFEFQDPGYRIVPVTKPAPAFLAESLSV